jgi:hypothetical protein
MKQDKNEDVLGKMEVKINVFDFLIVIMKHKKLILVIVFITGLFSATYSLTLKDHSLPKVMYRSECILRINPSDQLNIDGTNLESMALRIKSDLIPKSVFSKCQMQIGELVNIQYEEFFDMIKFEIVNNEPNANWFRISMETADPQLSQNILICFISELSNYLRDNTLESLESKKSFLRHNYEASNDIYKKQHYAEQIILIDKQINAIKIRNNYIFDWQSLPSAPKEYYQGSKSVNPILLTVFLMFISLILSITLSFFLEYLHTLKEKEP